MQRNQTNYSKRMQSTKKGFEASSESIISMFGKAVIVIIALGYLYGFVIIWSAYGDLGVAPFWIPVFLFIPPGLCFTVVVLGFMIVGIRMRGKKVKPFAREAILFNIDSAIAFTNVFFVFEMIFLGSDVYFKQLPKSNPVIFVIFASIIFFLIMFMGPARESGEKKIARIFGVVFVIVNLVFHIWNISQPMAYFFLVGVTITILADEFFTSDKSQIDSEVTTESKLKKIPNIVGFLVLSLVSAYIFGTGVYFYVKPCFGGGAYKESLIIMEATNGQFKSVFAEGTDSLYFEYIQMKEGILKGTIIGHSSDLYYIKFDLPGNRHKAIGIKCEDVRAILFSYSSEKKVQTDSIMNPSEADSLQ